MSEMELTKRIRASLAYTGTRQEELAHELQISKATMSRKMQDPSRFTWGEIMHMSELFLWNITVS